MDNEMPGKLNMQKSQSSQPQPYEVRPEPSAVPIAETQEWFGSDWRLVNRETSIEQIANLPLPLETEPVALTPKPEVHSEIVQPAIIHGSSYLMETIVQESLTIKAAEESSNVVCGHDEMKAKATPAAAITTKTVTEAIDSFADLEDLLQNRLPVDLCEAQLPLRISLFGRPAGPRRLRIDAAHSKIPAPHMNRTAEQSQKPSVIASAAATTPNEPSIKAHGSLDRALHYLQDRTDS
jgi:hypothetical protein